MPTSGRAIVIALILAANAAVGATEFTPCEREEGAKEPWYGDPPVGLSPGDGAEVLLAFSAWPSFSNSWGVDVIRVGGRHLLQLSSYRNIYAARVEQIGPTTFRRISRPNRFDRRVVTLSLDAEFASRLLDVAHREISAASPTARRYSFDGTGYELASAEGCASTNSPDSGTRGDQLVGVFHLLHMQASTPLAIRGLLRSIAYQQLRELDVEAEPMTTAEYALVFAGLGVAMAIALFPVVVALVTAFFPRRLNSRWKFVLKASALAYGLTCLVGIVLLPFWFGGSFLAVNLDIDGLPGVADIVYAITTTSGLVLSLVWIVSSLVVPIWLRRRGWPRVVTSSGLSA